MASGASVVWRSMNASEGISTGRAFARVALIVVGGLLAGRAGAAAAVTPQALGTNSNPADDTLALQALIDAAWKGPGVVRLDCREYSTTGLKLPTGDPDGTNRTLAIVGCASNHLGERYSADRQYGTRIRCSTANGTDCISAVLGTYQKPTYVFANLTIIGPDTAAPRTTRSGHGLRISGAGVPHVVMQNIKVGHFYGAGRAGIWLDNVEDSSLTEVDADYNDIGFKFSTGFNANVLVRCGAQMNAHFGIHSSGGQLLMFGGVVQSNERTGIYARASPPQLRGVHFENNNSSRVAGEWALNIESGDPPATVQHVTVEGGGFWTPRDRVRLFAGGSGATMIDVAFRNVYANGVILPFVTVDAASTGRVQGLLLDEAGGTYGDPSGKASGVTVVLGGNRAQTGSLAIGSGVASAPVKAVLSATGRWAATVSAGGTVETSLALPGSIEDDVVLFGGSVGPALLVTCNVARAGTVACTAFNPTARPVSFDRTVRVDVIRH